MREPVEVRRQRILAVVASRGTARVRDLASELEVSVVTVRRDVEELARAGKLRRGHGVVRPVGPADGVEGSASAARPAGTAAADGGPIALVVPERHSYLFEALHGARTVLEEAGRRTVLFLSPQAAGAERPLVERALASGASGLLIAPRWRSTAAEEADYDWLARLEVPTVLMERRPRPGSALHALDTVCSDHWYGVHLAVEHLTGLGHRRIVLAARDDSPTARAIRVAFTRIAATHPGVTDWTVTLSSPDAAPDASPEAGGPGSRARGEPLDLAGLLRARGATGAVLHGDVDALLLVQRLVEAGVRVPEDVSVVAYDDVVAALGSTPLTAVAPPKAEVGRQAARLLLGRLAAGASGGPHGAAGTGGVGLAGGAVGAVCRLELLPELKVRGSTRAVRPAPETPPATDRLID